jgi:hypothetical protein|tara:strand:+ start:459 stop:761 length:303 start_codon:yes stop_codon:yes gene_type:complete
MENIVKIIAEFGFPVAMALGMGYFIYYTWKFITDEVKPSLGRMFASSIKLTDQLRMLDQDMIRLQQKINVVLEYRERQQFLEEQKEEEELEKLQSETRKD